MNVLTGPEKRYYAVARLRGLIIGRDIIQFQGTFNAEVEKIQMIPFCFDFRVFPVATWREH